MDREKIITLIAEDMKHNKLLNGLESIGLSDNDRYLLSLDLFIAQLMGHESEKIPDAWLDRYQQTMLTIQFDTTPKEISRRAIILFESLTTI